MIFRNIRYFITQGFKGIWANSLMSLASICIVVASLILFGVFLLLGSNLNYLGSQIREQCEINVYLPRGVDRDTVRNLGSKLSAIPNVKEAQLYTKEERLQNYKDSVYNDKSDVINTLSEDNPLRDSYILVLKDVEKADEVATAASKVQGVDEVKNSQYIIQKIIQITNTVRKASIWLLILLAIISVFIISNTIKLGVFARRKEINIMKFVGATNWFIRWPFIIEGIILGVIGAMVAAGVVLGSYEALMPSIREFLDPIAVLKASDISKMLILSFVGLGVFIGAIGSYTAMRKHLRV